MSELCECDFKIKKTIISFNRGLYGVEYGVGRCFTDYKISFTTNDRSEILLPDDLFCPHNLPENYNRPRYFSVILK